MAAFLKPLFLRLKQALKNWTRPTSFAATAAPLADLKRTRTDLLIENALLRHQIVVLTRHSKRPQLTNTDLCYSKSTSVLKRVYLCSSKSTSVRKMRPPLPR
jgi:hypothetical protein